MNQKLENQLQLALQTNEDIRERTEDLNVGFDNVTETWELIVKYHGSLAGLEELGIVTEELIAGYAILTVPENLVEQVAEFPQIEYVEKPKSFYFEATLPARGSCISQVLGRELSLTGQGVLIAVLDSGIDYRLPAFRTENGTRIAALWDQTGTGEGGGRGRVYSREQINAALEEGDSQALTLVPVTDTSGHGTAVAGIAAEVAPEAELLIVKLGLPDPRSFPRTTQIMRGVTWAIRVALERNQPLVINLSFGNSYGAHDGTSLLERFLDNASEIGRTVICVGSGNDGANAGHLAGALTEGSAGGIRSGGLPAGFAELAIGSFQRSLSVQLWKNYSDLYRIRLRSPGGEEVLLPSTEEHGKFTFRLERTEVLLYMGEPLPYASAQEIYLEFLPSERLYLDSGVWTFQIEGIRVVTGRYYFYLPGGAGTNGETGFYRPTPEMTLTIPSTAGKVLTVGAYDSTYDSYAEFSGRGLNLWERTIGVVAGGITKPDLVAPGVDVLAPNLFGGYTPVTGTSFAAPIVSGSAALLMEWGIIQGNDLFLYGEKVKAYLRKGARPLRGESSYPNSRTGWGKLCVADSIPQ
ncbi:MAG: S8 family peptidase [Acetatifactor sp.]